MNELVYYLKSKRMKRFILLVMMVMSAGIMQAQFILQPEVGMTAVKRVEGYENWTSGWKLGAGVEYRFQGWLAVKSGLYYTQRGYVLPPYMVIMERESHVYNMQGEPLFEGDDLIGMSTGETKRHFLQIPFLAKVNIPIAEDIKLTVAGGPYIGYCFHNSYSYSRSTFGYREGGYGGPNSSTVYGEGYSPYYGYGYHSEPGYGYNPYNPFDGVRDFDWGINAEIGLEVKNVAFKLAYETSLAKEYDGGDNVKPKYHTFSVSIGYNFKLGK